MSADRRARPTSSRCPSRIYGELARPSTAMCWASSRRARARGPSSRSVRTRSSTWWTRERSARSSTGRTPSTDRAPGRRRRRARTELEGAGVEFDGETFDTGVCHMAHFTDPDGNRMTAAQRYAQYPMGDTDDRRRARRLHPRAGDGHASAANHFYGGAARPRAEPELARRRLGRVRGWKRHARGHDAAHARLRVRSAAGRRRSHCASPTSRRRRRSSRPLGSRSAEMWDSGRCRGAGVSDPAGNRILLHRRYAPYPDGSMP